MTGASGVATSPVPVANGTAGSYNVTASVGALFDTIRPDERGSVISILQGGTPTAFSPLLRPLVVVLARSAKARIKSNYA